MPRFLRLVPVVPALALVVTGTAAAGATVAVRSAPGGARAIADPATSPPGAAAAISARLPAARATAASRARAAVAPLVALHEPDAMVRVHRSLSAADMHALAALPGVTGAAPVDAGLVQVAGATAVAVGVDPSSFRGFTPRLTAASDQLWESVARGEMVASYALRDARPLPLGGTVPVGGADPEPVRVGAVAALGLPGVQVLVSHARARALGLRRAAGVVVSAPGRDPQALARSVRRVLGPRTEVALRHSPTAVRQAARTVAAGRPRTYQELYRAAARTCRGLSWGVLAAIGQVESDHGRNTATSSAGAMGPMQFLPSTFAQVAVDGDGDGIADIENPFDAVYSAARLLCWDGAGRGGQSLYDAVFAYNHADWYVRAVLALAKQYVAKYGA